MGNDAEMAYHRSYLSPYYLENLGNPGWFVNRRSAKEIETIRLRDEDEFEKVRENLARAIKSRFVRGIYVLESNVPLVGERRSHWREGEPKDYLVAEVIARTQRPQGAVKNPTTGMVALPVVAAPIKAYLAGNPLRPALIYAKTDQRFAEYATPWELQFSSLVPPLGMGFNPIINDSHQVVGHYFEGLGPIVLRYPLSDLGNNIGELMTGGIPVFYEGAGRIPTGWRAGNFYTSEHRVMVKTGIDGEVLEIQTSNTGYLTQPWYSPTDIFFAGTVVARLATAGVKISGSLMRRATMAYRNRTVLDGPTEALAREATEAAATGTAKQAGRRALSEVDLAPLARRKGTPSRELSPAEMEAFLRDVLKKRPYLSRLKGVTDNEELMKVIREWEQLTGKSHLKVSEGAVQRLGSEGMGGWALDKISGKEVMILEGKLFRNESQAVMEVMHELAYEAVWEGAERAIPHLNIPAGMRNAMQWLEAVLQHGEPAFQTLRSMGPPRG